jgi:RHS repeat-associated protein
LQYDYFLKDHLGNVRMLLTEQQQTDTYPAGTMELGDSTRDNTYYSNINVTRVSLPSGYPVDSSYSNPNNKVAKVNGSGNKIGPAIILKVMSGDKFNLRVSSWYKKNGATPQAPNNPITDLISALTGNIGNIAGNHGTVSELTTNNTLSPGAISFYTTHNSADSTTKPKAFINWVLFDEQFNYVAANSGFEQVGDDNILTIHTRTNQDVSRSGYLYIYVSNETPNIDVFFDNLQVTHIRGPLVEESHYYPFGLTMSGICSKALVFGGPENKYKFGKKELNNNELSDGSGLEFYDFGARMYDNQIGKFHIADPFVDIERKWSPYSYAYDNPLNYSDFNGLFPINPNGRSEYYKTRDMAAFAWAKLYGYLGANGKGEEYSAVIYSIKCDGVDVFGFTDPVQLDAKDLRWAKSPGPRDPVHIVPTGAKLEAGIHIHWQGSDKANETFSDNNGRGDSKTMSNNSELYFYLVNSVGKLLGRFPEELDPKDPVYDPSNPNANSAIEGKTYELAIGFYDHNGKVTVTGHKLVDEFKKGWDKPVKNVSPMHLSLNSSLFQNNQTDQSNDNKSSTSQALVAPVFY